MECEKKVEKLLSIVEAVARGEYEKDNWRRILDSVAELFEADVAAIGEVKEGFVYYTKVSGFLESSVDYDPERFKVPTVKSAFVEAVRRGYIIVNDYKSYRWAVGSWKKAGLKSALICVLGNDEPFGSLAVGRFLSDKSFTDEDGRILKSLAFIFSFIVKEELEKRKLLERATKDHLTGLYNRLFLEEALEREVSRANRYGFPLSLIMLDLDNFKSVNDRYGHDVGDRVLIRFAQVIKKNVRGTDIPARYGGEEFVVLLPHTGLEEAQRVAERIRSVFERTTFRFNGEVFRLTVSAGISSCHAGECNPRELLLTADKALYSAKRNGKNRVEVFSHAT